MNLNTHPAAPAQTNPLDLDAERASGKSVSLSEVVRIERVRLLTEVRPGYGRIADVSYIWGRTAEGELVHVAGYPATGLLRNVKGDFIAWAKEQGVFAKGIGLLDENNWSVMY